MKKIQRKTREAILYLTGKALILSGVVATISCCVSMYGPAPLKTPDYWSDQAPEQVDPLPDKDSKNNKQYEQTAEISTEDGSVDRR